MTQQITLSKYVDSTKHRVHIVLFPGHMDIRVSEQGEKERELGMFHRIDSVRWEDLNELTNNQDNLVAMCGGMLLADFVAAIELLGKVNSNSLALQQLVTI